MTSIKSPFRFLSRSREGSTGGGSQRVSVEDDQVTEDESEVHEAAPVGPGKTSSRLKKNLSASSSPSMQLLRKAGSGGGSSSKKLSILEQTDDDNGRGGSIHVVDDDSQLVFSPDDRAPSQSLSSPNSAQSITSELTSVSKPGDGFSFAPTFFKHNNINKSDRSEKHRRAISDQVMMPDQSCSPTAAAVKKSKGGFFPASHSYLTSSASFTTNTPLPPPLRKHASAHDDVFLEHPTAARSKTPFAAMSSKFSRSSNNKSSNATTNVLLSPTSSFTSTGAVVLEEDEQEEPCVEYVRFVRTGQPTVYFSPVQETHSADKIFAESRMDALMTFRGKVLKANIIFQPSFGSSGSLELDLPHHALVLVVDWVRLTTSRDDEHFSDDDESIVATMLRTLRIAPPPFAQDTAAIVCGFFGCAVLLEARMNGMFFLYLLVTCYAYAIASRMFFHRQKPSEPLYRARAVHIRHAHVNDDDRNLMEAATVEDSALAALRSSLQDLVEDPTPDFTEFLNAGGGRKLMEQLQACGLTTTMADFPSREWKLGVIERLDQYLADDDLLLKFLRAEKFKIPKTSKHARRSLIMRTALDLDGFPETHNMLHEYGSSHAKAISRADNRSRDEACAFRLKYSYVVDKDGFPVLLFRAGKFAVNKYFKLAMKGDVGALAALALGLMEELKRDAEYNHKKVNSSLPSQMSCAFDLADFSLGNLLSPMTTLSMVRLTFPIMTACYPEIIHRLILFNVPTVFHAFWQNLVRPFVSASLLDKLVIIGKGNVALKELRRYLPDDSIPTYLGGSLVGVLPPYEQDELCRDYVGPVGPTLPDKGIEILEAYAAADNRKHHNV